MLGRYGDIKENPPEVFRNCKQMIEKNGGEVKGKYIRIKDPGIKVLGALDVLRRNFLRVWLNEEPQKKDYMNVYFVD
jgi:hypothetical protein